ncbi:Protein of unknown function, partial [Gryllus bimaculatus]
MPLSRASEESTARGIEDDSEVEVEGGASSQGTLLSAEDERENCPGRRPSERGDCSPGDSNRQWCVSPPDQRGTVQRSCSSGDECKLIYRTCSQTLVS